MRTFSFAPTLAAMLLASALSLPAAAAGQAVTMLKNPSCECCDKWAAILDTSGFSVKTVVQANLAPVKDMMGVPAGLRSCHTALVGGYVVEGHVPADLVRKLLTDKPRIAGIAAPGMPPSSPGMDVPGVKQPYQVIAFQKNGQTSVYAQR
ncbi:metal-binding protein [Xenophilus sp. AP218F]|nr:metal-binding protein [Xenophilus sp. AP218F]